MWEISTTKNQHSLSRCTTVMRSTYLKGALSKKLHPLLQSPSCFKLELKSSWFVVQFQRVVPEENFRKLRVACFRTVRFRLASIVFVSLFPCDVRRQWDVLTAVIQNCIMGSAASVSGEFNTCIIESKLPITNSLTLL